MTVDRRTYTCWTLVYPAPDVPGEWIAHALEFDVMTQGTSPNHALEMAREAAAIAAVGDLHSGLDPADRRAPEEEWAPLYRLLREGKRLQSQQELEEFVRDHNSAPLLAFQMAFEVVREGVFDFPTVATLAADDSRMQAVG